MILLSNGTEELILGHIVNYAKGLYYRSDHLGELEIVTGELKIIIAHFLKREAAKIEFGMVLEYITKTAQRVNPDTMLHLAIEMTSPRKIKFHPGYSSFSSEYSDERENRDEGVAVANLNAKIIIRFLLSEIAKFKGQLPAPDPDILPLNKK